MTVPPLALAAFWIAVILAMTAGFVFFVRNWTAKTDSGAAGASELLSGFRRVHARGGISDAEFHRIRAALAPEVRREAQALATEGGLLAEAELLREEAAAGLGGDPVDAGDAAGPNNQGEGGEAAGPAAGDGCDAAPAQRGDVGPAGR